MQVSQMYIYMPESQKMLRNFLSQ